ncbi:MAG: phosphodiesterase [bacterium]|nr:phosphodiesterase [bacterium]
MEEFLTWSLRAAALVTLVAVPAYAARVRSRAFGIFGLVILATSLPGLLLMDYRLRGLLGPVPGWILTSVLVYGLLAAAIHLASLVTARLRPHAFRWAISIPGQAFLAAGFVSGAWLLLLLPLRALLGGLGFDASVEALRWADWFPFVLASASLVTSTRPVDELVRVRLGTDGPDRVHRVPLERYRRRQPERLENRPLRIAQIADPHLGPWQPIRKLRRRIDELIDRDPDLVLLTGDFLTMEGQETPGALEQALDPLRRLPGRCFAIFGNHDHESPDEVRKALAGAGVRLLIDEEVVAQTPVGSVQIVGADYVGRGRKEHIQGLLRRHARREDHVRILLLHDPLGFQHVPKGDVDLTLSGHTHGGQVGLVSLGLNWTVLSRSRWPDHGLFGHGSNRLYVHRGTGFYGFPLRIGVPGEASLLELVTD